MFFFFFFFIFLFCFQRRTAMKSTSHSKPSNKKKPEAKTQCQTSSLSGSEANSADILGSESIRSKIDPLSSMNAEFAAAIRANDAKTVEALLARGVSLASDGDGLTPLMLAARENSAECVRLLLPLSGLEEQDLHGCTALMFAASNGHAETLLILLPASKISVKGHARYPIWRRIGNAGALDQIAPVLRTLSVEQAQELDAEGDSILMIAAETGQTQAVKALLEKGDFAEENAKGRTPLLLAAEKGHGACVRLLAPLSDCSKTVKDGETALMRAIAVCSVEAVEALLPFSNPDAVTGRGFDAWHFCELMLNGGPPGADACADAVGSRWLTKKTIDYAHGKGSQHPKERMERRRKELPRIFARIEVEALKAAARITAQEGPSDPASDRAQKISGAKRV